MSENDEKQKEEEKRVTRYFYEKMKKNNIEFLNFNEKYPDCLIKLDNKKIAIELTRYYNQNTTKETQNFRNMIKTWLKNDENILKMLSKRIRKPLCQGLTINYKNIDILIKDILEVDDYIKEIDIKKKYIYFKETVNETNHSLPEVMTKKRIITVNEYLECLKRFLIEGEEADILLKCKKGQDISISVKCDILGINQNNREIRESDVWFENKNEIL